MRRIYIMGITGFLLLLSVSGCWKENLSNCWEGDVIIRVAVEKFQQRPDGELEDNLGKRIKTLRYYLYKGDELYDQGVIDSPEALNVDELPLVFPKLKFGDYSLALLGNVDGDEVRGTEVAETLSFDYPGASQTKDYQVSYYNFTVDCDCGLNALAVLRRAQGVTQFRLKNLPDNISEIEVELNGVSQVCGADTLYGGETMAAYRVVTEKVGQDDVAVFELGSFPTVVDGQTEVILKLYADSDPGFLAFHSRVGTIQISRNQLIRVETDFNHDISGEVGFTIKINPSWDGVGGGELPVE